MNEQAEFHDGGDTGGRKIAQPEDVHPLRQLYHDLRIEFNHITLLAAKLKRSGCGEVQAVGAKIDQAVRRAADLIATEEDPKKPEQIDVNAVVRDMYSSFEVECQDLKVAFELNLGQDLRSVHMIRTDLEVILRNLLSNAIEAMPNGGKLLVETQNAEAASAALTDNQCPHLLKPDVVLVVTDTGKGMSEQLQRMIFKPFYSTKGEGRGIGLHTIEKLVRRNNGAISVCSAPGAGTRFQLLFCADPPR